MSLDILNGEALLEPTILPGLAGRGAAGIGRAQPVQSLVGGMELPGAAVTQRGANLQPDDARSLPRSQAFEERDQG